MPVYKPVLDAQSIANLITSGGYHWNQTQLTYSFNNLSTAGNTLDATFQLWVNRAFEIIEEMIGIDFVLTSGIGNITLNGSRGDGTYATGDAGAPSNDITWAAIFFDQNPQEWWTNQSANLSYGSYGFLTIIHEILHAIGLEHPGNYNVTADYGLDALFLQDTRRYTVMSYFDAYEDGSGTSHWAKVNGSWTWIYAQTPMVYDLLALTDGSFAGLFAGYNLNTATRAGDTVYGYNASSGINAVYNFAGNVIPVLTIYDAGGVDTLDLSGDFVTTTRIVTYDYNNDPIVTDATRTTTVIDIRPGQYSSTNGMTNNVGIAFGTLIENVIGTMFHDNITGNDAANIIYGASGNDIIEAGDGYDWVSGGSGRDVLYGGGGLFNGDTISYADSTAGVIVNLQRSTATGGFADGDSIWGFENVEGSAFSDILTGAIHYNGCKISGGPGNDYLISDTFFNSMYGGSGADWFVIGSNGYSNTTYSSTIYDYQSNDYILITNLSDLPKFETQGQDVYIGGTKVLNAASGNLTVFLQRSNTLGSDANLVAIQDVLTYGLFGIQRVGAYSVAILDANYDESWHAYVSSYTAANLLDYNLIYADDGAVNSLIKYDWDEDASQVWASIGSYYLNFFGSRFLDFEWIAYDPGQPYSLVSRNYDPIYAETWSEIQTFYSAANVTDFSYIYYDSGQPLFSAAVDYDQADNQTWGRIETFFSSSGVTDYYWTYYDAGQAYYAATIDYDQINAQTWYRIDTFFSSAGVTDFTWAYFDAGQPVAARLVDYDQANLYSWDRRIVEYGPGGVLLNDYYI
jgi:Peptidase M10 serralysin C terminal/Matrixin/RTX calcium-binding nonapeptide repeat (4 copies)